MKRVVIHAGPGKTGTSAVQYWLSRHGAELAANGIFYPSHAVDSNNVSSGNKYRVLEETDSGELTVSRAKVQQLMEEFQGSGCDLLLLSSEFFFYRIRELREYIPQAEFVVYLRNPMELLESGYNQGVKRHGRTTPFVVPPKFRFNVLEYLEEMHTLLGRSQLSVRPYGREFFVGGSIIADVLSVLGAEISVVDDSVVNPSYTFDAMEFKRHANFFPIEEFASELDRVLQACPIGEREFSLMTNQAQNDRLVGMLTEKLDAFIEKTGLEHLRCLGDLMERGSCRVKKRQMDLASRMHEIARFVHDKSPDVYEKLQTVVEEYPMLALPDKRFYDCFGVTGMRGGPADDDFVGVISLASRLLEKNIRAEGDVCRELGLFFEKEGRYEDARYFMEAALHLKPNAAFIQVKVNELRMREKKMKTLEKYSGRSRGAILRNFLGQFMGDS